MKGTTMRTKIILGLTTAACLLVPRANAADHYKIDPAHSRIGFSIRHMGISNVRGHFNAFLGAVVLDNGALQEASGTIQVKSVDTGIEQRDNHLRTAEFFDAAKYPVITFKTKRVENSGEQPRLIADFTMHGVTKELALPVTLSGPIKDPQGNFRIGLEARTKLNRKDYGINFSKTMDTGGLLVGEEVEIEINAEAIKEAAGGAGNK
jgi:polyisoprenoid-binding protein YceI